MKSLPIRALQLSFFLIFLSVIQHATAQEEKFKALFIYNFTKYIEWPSEMGGNDFQIGVLGDRDILGHLNEIASKMKVGSKSIKVNFYTSVDEIPFCHIVFINATHTMDIPAYAKKTKGMKVLIIGDKEKAYQKGACINFIKKNGNLNYEISKSNMDAQELKYVSTLNTLGTLVE
jgi:hypothetical protein